MPNRYDIDINKKSTISGFHSKQCEMNNHDYCDCQWLRLEFKIICDCNCGYNKKGTALAEVEGQETNAHEVQPSNGGYQKYDQ